MGTTCRPTRYSTEAAQQAFFDRLIDRVRFDAGRSGRRRSRPRSRSKGAARLITVPGEDNARSPTSSSVELRVAGLPAHVRDPAARGPELHACRRGARPLKSPESSTRWYLFPPPTTPSRALWPAIVNRTMARLIWGKQDPLGRTFSLGGSLRSAWSAWWPIPGCAGPADREDQAPIRNRRGADGDGRPWFHESRGSRWRRVDVSSTGSSSSIISIERIFGQPVIEPPGERRANQIHGILVVSKITANQTDQVIDVFVRLDALVFDHVNRSGWHNLPMSFRRRSTIMESSASSFGWSPARVACFGPARPFCLGERYPRSGASPPSFREARRNARRSRKDLVIAGLDEGEERRWIRLEHAGEEGEGVAAKLRLESLRHVHLIDVATHDVVANGLDRWMYSSRDSPTSVGQPGQWRRGRGVGIGTALVGSALVVGERHRRHRAGPGYEPSSLLPNDHER